VGYSWHGGSSSERRVVCEDDTPDLQFKKVEESNGQEVVVGAGTLNYRTLAPGRAGGFLWFRIGDHKSYEELI